MNWLYQDPTLTAKLVQVFRHFDRYAGYSMTWRRWLDLEYPGSIENDDLVFDAMIANDFTIRMTGGFTE